VSSSAASGAPPEPPSAPHRPEPKTPHEEPRRPAPATVHDFDTLPRPLRRWMVRPPSVRILAALTLAAAGAGLQSLVSVHHIPFPFPGAFAGVLVAAWLLGAVPAAVAAVAGLVLVVFFVVPPEHPILGRDLLLYGFFSLLVCGMAIHRARAERSHIVRHTDAHHDSQTLAALLDTIPEGVVVVDDKGKIRCASRRGAEISGTEASSLTGARISDLLASWRTFHPDGTRVPESERPFNRLARGETVADVEVIVERPDGRRIPILVNGVPIHGRHLNGGQSIIGAVMIYRDISAEKAAQAALAESAHKYRLLFEQAAFPKWLVDLETLAFLEVNDAAVRTYGYSREQFLGMSLSDLRPTDEPPTELELHHTLDDHFEGTMNTRHRTLDGRILTVEMTARFIDTHDSGYRHMLVEIFDTTRITRSREELERSNTELEQFAHAAAHDLKEPLRGLTLYASFLTEDYSDILPPEAQRMISTISRLAARGTALIDALLDYSQAGRTQLRIVPVDLNILFNEVVENLATLAAEQHAIVTRVNPLPTLLCDRVQTGRILANLIINAIKYNENDPKRVEVGSLRDPNRPHPVLYVRDNGIGIRPEHHERIFQMFRRLHLSDAYGGGTGAGLALVQKLVRRHSGEVWLDSAPGRGSTFFFTLGPEVDTPARR
jgi:PAS domain S-box-containing protein